MRKLVITGIPIGTKLHLNLRYYDGDNKTWFEGLHLPHKHKDYVVEIMALRWKDNAHTRLVCSCATFLNTLILNNYDVSSVTTLVDQFNVINMVLVTQASQLVFPQIFI